jgi:hypothetical protein
MAISCLVPKLTPNWARTVSGQETVVTNMTRCKTTAGWGLAVALVVLPTASPLPAATPVTLYDQAKAYGKGGVYQKKISAVAGPDLSDVIQMRARSQHVVAASPIFNRATLTSDGTMINTQITFKIHSVVSGDGTLKPGQSIVVSLPGGSHRYEDGTIVSLYSVYYRPPLDSKKQFLLFLQRAYGAWSLVGGAQGQFDIDGQGKTVRPADLRAGPLQQSYKDAPLAPMLLKLRK